MNNISWAENMDGYTEDKHKHKRSKEKPVEVIECKSNDELLELLEAAQKEFDLAYKANPCKELYDSIISLNSIKLN